MSLVKLENIVKIYQDKNKIPVQALNEVSLNVKAGEFIAIAGPSGSGKTTLLNIIGGLDRPTSGKVRVAESNLTDLDRNELAEFRLRTLGFVFQAHNLIPVLTAEENAEFTLLLQGVSKEERHQRVKEEFLDLGEVGGGILTHLVPREYLAGDGLTRGVPHQAGGVANKENDGVARILEMAQLTQKDCMAKVQIGGGGVKAGFDDQRTAGVELRAELLLGEDLDHAPADQLHGLCGCHDHVQNSFPLMGDSGPGT